MKLFKKKYTIGDLMSVDANRQEKAGHCTVQLIKIYYEVKQESLLSKLRAFFGGKSSVLALYIILKLKVTSDTGNTHTVFIKLDPDFDLNHWLANRIEIYCDCADFKYRSAYDLGQHDSLFVNDRIKIALGSSLVDAPKADTKRSPLCKHAVAAIQWVISNYGSIMRTI